MGWLWLIFVVFTVLSNLMEKAAKVQRPSDLPRKNEGGSPPSPPPVAFPPFFWEESEAEEEPLTVEEANAGRETVMQHQSEKIERRPLPSLAQPQKARKDELDQVALDDLAWEEMSGYNEGETKQKAAAVERENLPEEGESADLSSAIVLAQVLARPDFKTIPWQRRL